MRESRGETSAPLPEQDLSLKANMASTRSCRRCCFRTVAAAAVLILVMAVTSAKGAYCPFEESTKPVYPYWSLCIDPAVYGSAEQYQFQGLADFYSEGGLAPEWDESNSTYYVRLSQEMATYQFSHPSDDHLRFFVSQEDAVVITNVETGRVLAWRQEGADYFLVEVEEAALNLSLFQVVQFEEAIELDCPSILTARCQAYELLSYNTTFGAAPYDEDGAVYFKLSDDDVPVPFVLLRSSSSGLPSAVPTKIAHSTPHSAATNIVAQSM